jgi:hypothetical protein
MRLQRVIVIKKRIHKLRATFKLDTQQLRYNLINRLTELFNDASHLAKSRDIEVKDRQEWTRIAGYIAQTIESVSKGYDERQIDRDLAELEKMIDEAKAKRKDGQTQGGLAGGKGITASEGSAWPFSNVCRRLRLEKAPLCFRIK